ncbi:MAG: hypothetical protein NC341_10850 [Blautia sp.]|nr:hypothetical protein [Blautia sp.]MCM1200339.1 hypothetical protein [Bacteroides fragilis]
MRAKWRKAIWAILAVQLLLMHLLFMDKVLRNAYRLDYLIGKAVGRLGLPYVLYNRWRYLVIAVWLISSVCVMLFHYLNYIRFRRNCISRIYIISDESVKQNLKCAVEETGLRAGKKEDAGRTFLYGSNAVREPFIIGFRKPILILPEREYSGRALHFIFLHECYHIRHKDTLYKLFLLFMQSMLWFQPLIYLLKAVGGRDVEAACDEAVVEGRDMAERKEYGYALLECMEQERVSGQAYSAYFYHGKRMMKARISAIMREDERLDSLAYAAIAVLLADVVFSTGRIGYNLYDRYRTHQIQLQAEEFGYDENGEPRTSIYDGYELPAGFSQAAVDAMVKLEPVSENAYYEEWQRADVYEEKEYAELPYAAEGPWQVRLKDADRYRDAVPLLLQRYLFYYVDQERIAQWNPEEYEYTSLETVSSRLLAGDKREAAFAVVFRYYIGYEEEELRQFPRELRGRAQISHEKGGYYAYFNWTVHIRMIQDYVFELEGVAETEDVLAAYVQNAQQTASQAAGENAQRQDMPAPAVSELLDDVPEVDLVYGIDDEENRDSLTEEGNGSSESETVESACQVDTSEGILKVSGADGVWKEVPITLEELYGRGDEMDGKLTSLQEGSYQVDENKIVFAYGGSSEVPFSVVFYEEESRSFKKSIVTYDYFGGRKIYVDFPENGQEGFLIFTGERVVWQESTILFHTEDGGKSWQFIGEAGPDMTMESHSLTTGAVFINNRVGFVTIRDSETPDIWRTEDGGKTWEKQTLPEVPEYYCMAYAPEQRSDILCLYVGMEEYSEYGGTKAKYESADEGRTWEYKGIVVRK